MLNPNHRMKKIIIIGIGIGGSGIGALISKNTSHQIQLFEKNKIIGGRCASYGFCIGNRPGQPVCFRDGRRLGQEGGVRLRWFQQVGAEKEENESGHQPRRYSGCKKRKKTMKFAGSHH